MIFFQSPPPTRYDLRFSLLGFPVRVHPLFWLIAVLLGSASADPIQILIWVLVVFVSILVHELGHALAFRRYGLSSQIVLHFAGGLTIPESTLWGSKWANVALGPNQEIFISLAGPGAGFLFAVLVIAGVVISGGSIIMGRLFGIIPLPAMALMPFGGNILNSLVTTLLWVNIFWGLINLLPVYPLDGGNVARYISLQVDPVNGIRKSLWVSVIAGGLIAVAALLLLRSVYMALLFGLLAFQSYQLLQSRF
ncbi:MAG TPA: site-2 protease family protein [Anaerolineales bacterium]|nr:site-2 protease family protein [Anaerolineales bacterium]HLO31968.1 site-2 protease family protein [Anaerolineales bacterium]